MATTQKIEAISQKIATTTDREKLARLYVERGFSYSQANAFKEGADDFTHALTLWSETPNKDPGIAYVYYWRGLNYKTLELNASALDDISKAIRIWPKDKDPGILATAYFVRAQLYGKRLHQAMPEDRTQQWQDEFHSTGTLIIADTTEALRLWPATSDTNFQVEVLFQRGITYFGSGERQLALDDLEAALRLNPNSHHLQKTKEAVLRAMTARGESPN